MAVLNTGTIIGVAEELTIKEITILMLTTYNKTIMKFSLRFNNFYLFFNKDTHNLKKNQASN